MRSDRQINLLIPDVRMQGEPAVMVQAHFPDDHPAWWSDAAHHDGRLVVLTSARGILEYSTISGFLMTCWVALIPFALNAFDTGTGSRRPPPA